MYAPSAEGRYKIYILDEAHMLTREAWNALLKILEEPPPRVIFIFATTEPQKIQQSASPILSRCQRFDFRRIGVGDITRRLQEVTEGEEVEAPSEALRTLARRAGGGMRDALSLLDQVLALTGGEISQEAVRRVLGLVEEERYLELLEILVERRHGQVFSFVEELLEEGYDMVEFHRGLIDTLRTLLRIRLGEEGGGRDLREDLLKGFQERAGAFAPGDLVRMLAQATELEATGSLRRSAHPRLLLEMLLLRLSYLDRTLELEELLKGLGGEEAFTEPPEPTEAEVPAPAATTLVEAWDQLLSSPEDLPNGLLPFLRASTVDFSQEGKITLSLPPGPGLERLQDAPTAQALKEALTKRSPDAFDLEVRAASVAETRQERITEGSIREGRLKELMDKEPALGEAVEKLDLELLD
jgi:DNA polymerase-3 subunit gamma/tau